MSELMVDEQFLNEVTRFGWRKNGIGYLCGQADGKNVYLHRYVWGLAHEGLVPRMLDHINGNKLDNRIANLRPATGSLNCRSRVRSGGGRLPEGVQPKPGPKPYFAHICLWRATLYLGSFRTVEQASSAYETARRIILACEARRALSGEPLQPVPPPARSQLKRFWNVQWRCIFACGDFDAAVDSAIQLASDFTKPRAEVAT
jgi:hypothetical protein